jgi:hypothetical protein
MMKRLLIFGTACVIVSTVLGIILIATKAHAQQQPNQQQLNLRQIQQTIQQPPPFSNPFANQYQPPNQQQPLQQPQPQQQYPPQLQNQFRQPQMQPQPQQGQGLGILMNESKVISCLNHVLSDSIVKAHGTKQNETTFINNATSTLDSCILPRR